MRLFVPIALLGLMVSGNTLAQGQALRSFEGSSDLPDSISFQSIVGGIADASAENPNDAGHATLHALSLSHDPLNEALAAESAIVLVDAHEQLAEEIRDTELRILCGRVFQHEHQIYRALTALDAVRVAIGDKYLRIAKSQIDPELSDALLNAISLRKLGITYIEIDHQAVYEAQGINPFESIAAICDSLKN